MPEIADSLWVLNIQTHVEFAPLSAQQMRVLFQKQEPASQYDTSRRQSAEIRAGCQIRAIENNLIAPRSFPLIHQHGNLPAENVIDSDGHITGH